MSHALRVMLFAVTLVSAVAVEHAAAQSKPAPPRTQAAQRRPAPRQPKRIDVRGIGLLSTEWFAANQSFEAILGSSRGTMFGGGLSVTEGEGYIDVTAQRFKKDGSRAFVVNNQVFPLGIPTTITVIPLDVTLGWRFRNLFKRGLMSRFTPHAGAGYTHLRYEETSDFADASESAKKSANGFHVIGGAEVRLHKWAGVAGEVMWTSVGKALGESGVSAEFNEKNLGGTTLRLKLVIGR